MDTYIEDVDPAFEKLLSDNRDRYIEQSSKTRYGLVPQLPHRDRDESADWKDRVKAEMSVWFSDLD